MSMPFSAIKCASCSRRWFTHDFWGLHSYRLPDDRDAWVDRTLAWCDSCDDFVMMERFPEPKEIEEKLTEASRELEEKTKPKEYLLFGFIKRQAPPKPQDVERYQRWLREAEALRDWRAMRQSPPKCLSCGSTKVQEARLWENPENEPIHHPKCGGEFLMEESEARISKRLKHRFYDVEGNFLWEEYAPP